jgi:beta-hydroxylase
MSVAHWQASARGRAAAEVAPGSDAAASFPSASDSPPLSLPPVGLRPTRERWAARAALLRRQPRLAGPLALRSAVEGLIRLSPGGSTPVFDPADFPWTRDVEAQAPAIQAELRAVLDRWEEVPPFQVLQPEQERLTTDDRWRTYVLYAYGRWCARNRAECPATARALEGIPGLRAAMFSLLAPGKRIPPHRGPYAGVLRYHLGLHVPQPRACGIRVRGVVARWREGRSLVFDDSFDHEAWNDSDQPRAVLFVDVERPLPGLLAALNRRFLDALARSEFVTRGQENLDRWYGGAQG